MNSHCNPSGAATANTAARAFRIGQSKNMGTLDTVNQKWGTAFGSQIYTDWKQIPVPLPSNAPPNPGLALDYDRYQSHANASFSGEQLVMLRQQCPRHFISTNSVGAPFDTLNVRELFHDLDFVSHDNYPGFAAMFMQGEITPERLAFEDLRYRARLDALGKRRQTISDYGGAVRKGRELIVQRAAASGPIKALGISGGRP